MSPVAPVDPLLGKVLDNRFEILERIGEGGMGVVYRARQISVDRMVAIKVLNAQVANDPTWVQRFNNEARACSKLQHPNTIRLIDFGQSREGLLFIAMEFLDGSSIRAALDRGGPMPWQRVMKILVQICQSLAEAHALGIIHRDLKPDNLFLVSVAGQTDFVKVLDFSVAKLKQQGNAMQTQAGVVFGTPQYMSPEQGRGLPLDARSDIYALGIVAYEMLTGHAPFNSENPMEVLAMHVRTPPPPLANVPASVSRVIMKSLAKNAHERPQTVEALLAECQQVLNEAGVSIPSPHAAGLPPAAAAFAHQGSEAKTMFVPGGGAPAMPGPGHLGHEGATMAAPLPAPSSEAKTMMAVGGQFPMPSPAGASPLPAAPAQPHLQASSASPLPVHGGDPNAPQKTMMLDSSEGVVSFAREGKAPPAAAGASAPQPIHAATPVPVRPPLMQEVEDLVGPSALFWIACIVGGAAVGAGAWFAYVKLAG